ncbi:MAG: hypothetical protein AAFO29_12850 [Actinomycetota bacterium]
MILDGSTDWDPEDGGEAADPGETVGIGPLPKRGPAGRAGGFDDAPGTPDAIELLDGGQAGDATRSIDSGQTTDADRLVDPRPMFGPVTASADADRPPMVTDRSPAASDRDEAPQGWIATGPLPAGAATVTSGVEPLPTGPVPITPIPTGAASGLGASARVAAQAAVVVLAAGLVGLVVYGVLRSAAGSTGTSEEAEADGNQDEAVAPGPGDPSGGGLSGSRRDTTGFGDSFDDADDADAADPDPDQSDTDPASGENAAAGTATDPQTADGENSGASDDNPDGGNDDGSAESTALGSDGRTPPPGNGFGDEPAGPTTVPGRSGPFGSTNDPPLDDPSGPSTTPTVSGSSTTNAFDRTSTTGVVTTRPTTPSSTIGSTTTTTTSTDQTTTTRSSTTTSPPPTTTSTTSPPPADLIAWPRASSGQTWELGLALRSNQIAGAENYCWTLIGAGGELTQCRDETSYRLPARRTIPGPGPVTIRAEARSADGAVLASQQIGVDLLSRRFAVAPRALTRHRLDETLRLETREPPNADRYCWSLTQGDTSSGPICSSDDSVDLEADGPVLSPFEPGAVLLRVTAELDGQRVGRQDVLFRFTDG